VSTSDTQYNPKHMLSSSFTLAVTIGGIIGLGILRTPGIVAKVSSDPYVFMTLWVLGGLFVLLTANAVAELVGMTPRSGGTYSLVRRAYGPFPGFVIGWVDWLSFAADIAVKAIVITEFAAMLFPASIPWQTPLAIAVSSLFAGLQLGGVSLGAKIQEIAAAVMTLVIIGYTMALAFADSVASSNEVLIRQEAHGLGAWSLMIAAIIYTYDGWSNAAYFSGEIKEGSGAVARTCIKGVAVVLLLYWLLLSVLAWKVPLASLADKDLALAVALEMVVSPATSTVVLVVAIAMLLAHQNLLYMATPRILQALAVDGLAVKRAGEISKGGNPIFAVLLTWGLSVALISIGGFNFLLHLSIFFYLFIYVVLIAGVLVLRKSQPHTERPYQAWGHPLSTYLCLFGWLAIGLFQAVTEVETVLYAVVMVVVSWPAYRGLVRFA